MPRRPRPGQSSDGGPRRRAAGGEGAEDIASVAQLAECAPPPIAPPAPAGAAGESAGPGRAPGLGEAAAPAPEASADAQPGCSAVPAARGGARVTRLVPLRVGAARGLRGLRGVQILAASADGALRIWHSNGGRSPTRLLDTFCLLCHMHVHCATDGAAELPRGWWRVSICKQSRCQALLIKRKGKVPEVCLSHYASLAGTLRAAAAGTARALAAWQAPFGAALLTEHGLAHLHTRARAPGAAPAVQHLGCEGLGAARIIAAALAADVGGHPLPTQARSGLLL